jgi:thiopurine S-methyltransferase
MNTEKPTLDAQFWNDRYLEENTGWDIGDVSPPLTAYVDQLESKALRILIPGCGRAYEASYLLTQGFEEVTLVDWSQEACDQILSRIPALKPEQVLCENFFELKGKFDLIIEQTFFCAIDPSLRADYVEKTYELLDEGGKIMGLLWDDPMYDSRPPFGGDRKTYEDLFSPYFEILILETAHNSIKPRAGREFFFLAKKRSL